MSKDNILELDGVVKSARGNGLFLVKVNDSGTEISCTLSGKIRQNSIRILENDKVKIEVSAYDLTKGRITYRSKD